MLALGLEGHQINHVDYAHLQFRKIAAQHFNRGEGFQSWHVTGASHDDIRFAALIVAGPGPNADAGRAMLNSALNVEPLRGGLFTGDNDVDIMTAAQAMVSDGEKSVCVGRQIDANYLGFLVHRMIDEARVLMAESVMVLTPNMRGQQIIQRGQRTPPRNVTSDLEPLGVLIEHGINDVNESLVTGKEAMTASEQITLQPALAKMLAQNFHYSAIRSDVLVGLEDVAGKNAIGGLENRGEAIGFGFVQAEEPEVALISIKFDDVAEECAHDAGGLGSDAAGLRNSNGVLAEVRHPQFAQQKAAVRVGVGAHPAVARGREFGQVRFQLAGFVEQFAGPVTQHPFFQQFEMIGLGGEIRQRDLVRAPGAFGWFAIDFLRPRPAFGAAQNDHGPERAALESIFASV